jgi:hypothetical protein
VRDRLLIQFVPNIPAWSAANLHQNGLGRGCLRNHLHCISAQIVLPYVVIMECGATISRCGNYRYDLRRLWSRGPEVVWILLNPSKADAQIDDPTIRKCIGFSKRWGYGGMRVVNLFAFRATCPDDLFAAADPIGPRNNKILRSASTSDCIVAWGNHGNHRNRAAEVLATLQGRLDCLGVTNLGQPKHPVRLAYATPRQIFQNSSAR